MRCTSQISWSCNTLRCYKCLRRLWIPLHSTAISGGRAILEYAIVRTAFAIVVAVIVIAGHYAASTVRARGVEDLAGIMT